MERITFYKDIPGYEELYKINHEGTILRLSRKRSDGRFYKGGFLKPQLLNTGYLQVGLYRNKRRKGYGVHRLVALAFIPNSNNLPEINHKDGNRQNNYFANLEWCTKGYNTKDSFNRGRIVWNKGKKIGYNNLAQWQKQHSIPWNKGKKLPKWYRQKLSKARYIYLKEQKLLKED